MKKYCMVGLLVTMAFGVYAEQGNGTAARIRLDRNNVAIASTNAVAGNATVIIQHPKGKRADGSLVVGNGKKGKRIVAPGLVSGTNTVTTVQDPRLSGKLLKKGEGSTAAK